MAASPDQAPSLQQLFPPPPPFFKLYREDADGSAESPLPPEPPRPVEGTYQMFGELHTTEDGLPPLHGLRLYTVQEDGKIGLRGELLRLRKELVGCLMELLRVLTDRPSFYARAVENMGTLLRNLQVGQVHHLGRDRGLQSPHLKAAAFALQHLLNAARPYQARASLLNMLRREIEERQRAVQELRAASSAAGRALHGGADRLAAAMAELQTALQRAAEAAGGSAGGEAAGGGGLGDS